MAGYTYYYMFSLIAAFMPALLIANFLSVKRGGRAIDGQRYKKGTVGYKRITALGKPWNLTIVILVGIIFIANLIFSLQSMASLNTSSSRFALVAIPIVLSVMIAIALAKMRKSGSANKRN